MDHEDVEYDPPTCPPVPPIPQTTADNTENVVVIEHECEGEVPKTIPPIPIILVLPMSSVHLVPPASPDNTDESTVENKKLDDPDHNTTPEQTLLVEETTENCIVTPPQDKTWSKDTNLELENTEVKPASHPASQSVTPL